MTSFRTGQANVSYLETKELSQPEYPYKTLESSRTYSLSGDCAARPSNPEPMKLDISERQMKASEPREKDEVRSV